MKTQKQNKMALKKLTIASINTQNLHLIKGGSSVPTDAVPTVKHPGGPCVQVY
ncbi:hypothetical protein [Aquimarina spongiae]|uniref:Natural product n=1 Tax=Aquimarina spongiae TaxID=570521 RepID=A0A1M6JJW5_9FLAO|nr:hypothetical protein [Aquimarina spongiae]SHJ46963.1 hypothetical protein SAMN04488508_109105 [Aquimarina spongiae]